MSQQTAPPQSRRVLLDTGLTYHFLEWNPEHNHTIVLVHGFLDFCTGWTATVREGLAEHFHVVAPDMRGHGDSDWVGAGGYYHFMDYVADLHSFIKKLGKSRVSLVGHSMGGSIASYYAGCFPESLQHLVLMEGMGPLESQQSPPDQIRQWIRSWNHANQRPQTTYPHIEDAAHRLRKRDPLLGPELALELATAGTRLQNDGTRVFKHDPVHLSRGAQGYSVAISGQFWQQITCPVLLVDGALSDFRHTPEEDIRRKTYFLRYNHIVIDEAGHMMQRHQPKRLAQILINFLT